MTRPVAVLRPEPGNATTAARIEAAGLPAIRLPLFRVTPLTWEPPDPAGFDALLLTSANALRLGGGGLARLRSLPVLAVGAATAAAARAAGFSLTLSGDAGVAALAGRGRHRRLLHLAGREHEAVAGATPIVVYAADPAPVSPEQVRELAGGIALVHSPRAARRLGELVDAAGVARGSIMVAALSDAVASAAGDGWAAVTACDTPRDDALVALAARLAADHPIDRALLDGDNRRQ